MYVPPTIYGSTRVLSGDQLKRMQVDGLAMAHQQALEEVVAGANAAGDMLDPNSVLIKVTVEARAL